MGERVIEERRFRFVVDLDKKKPACVLLQAVWGGDRNAMCRFFPAAEWLTFPTPGMRMVEGTESEWRRVASLWKQA